MTWWVAILIVCYNPQLTNCSRQLGPEFSDVRDCIDYTVHMERSTQGAVRGHCQRRGY